MHEIILPETKPALEWVNGRALQKMSPRRKHGLAQSRFVAALDSWAQTQDCGTVATEWEFRIAPPGEVRRPLVPDVAYLSYAQIPLDRIDEADIPRVAPDAVVEVISPGDRMRDIEEKTRVYLASGTSVIFLVDTDSQTVTARDAAASVVFGIDDTVGHRSLPGFSMPARRLFEMRFGRR
ncbi:MAG TPA: Uma2 family endonuclease [Candidatus Eremiobacteraceae bacterium]|nr:Uma2 family endonuclease [Candidatus Eremiobacteraceae bacterium]